MAEDPLIENADRVAEELAKRNRQDLKPEVTASREAELDEAFAAASQKAPPPEATPENFGRDNKGVPIKVEGAPKEEKPPEEIDDTLPAANPPPEQKPADTPSAEEPKKGLLEDLLAEPKTPEQKPADDPYAQVRLRSDASPKTRETFENLKKIAQERETAALTKAEAAQKQLEELQTKVAELEKRTVPDDVSNELKELRAFRAQFDTEHDPEFRSKFDGRIEQNYESVYAKLRAYSLPEAEIQKLKTFSPAQRDEAIERFLPKLPSFDRKYIEAKLLDNVNTVDQRETALREARAKADELLKAKKEAPVVQTAQRDAKVAEILRPVLPKLPWIHVREVPSTAAPEEKKRIESENTFALQMQEALKAAIVDDSPQTRAEAAIAVPLAQFYRRELSAVTAQRDALQKQLDSIKAAGATSRTARSVASSTPPPAQPKPAPTNSADAIDQLWAEVQGRK